ncbi:LuxR C-terminal-related transcriptional regulator [Variovorax soli]|uniref:LuxR family maltose regulon positive regulatory protein n=1 Tax=Variovorax soli TaxID=376815 RepID=A0ABU1NLQ7_9BURK|nr:LuxR C-terminal-related transcriptional regulator [Variovorax soli]MDR6539408.1 LuxR family maltose regulon positive regulatory protein [Variovorax soli]
MQSASLARAKIQTPRFRSGLIERSELEEQLGDALTSRRLVLLVAPAGYGKTAALSRQLQRLPPGCAVAWLTADEEDDLHRFLYHLIEALEPLDPPWRLAPEALLERVAQGRLREAASAVLSAIEATETCGGGVIVLDDLHAVSDPRVFEFLGHVLEGLPQNWTLVIASRVEPPLALGRWRARREVAEFDETALGFSRKEVQALWRHATGREDPEQAQRLHDRTQGWAAGLCLSLETSERAAAKAPTGVWHNRRHLFEYLASEVFEDLPSELQEFLLRCSPLSELTVARCVQISGNPRAARLLENIERRRLFISVLDSDELTLRLHDLFRDFLEERLRRRHPDEVPALLRRAAQGEADPVRRTHIYLRAGAWDEAQQSLAGATADMLADDKRSQVLRVIEQFPPEIQAHSPLLAYARGLCTWPLYRYGVVRSAMADAAAGFDALGRHEDAQRARATEALALLFCEQMEDARRLSRAVRAQPMDHEAEVLSELFDFWYEGHHGPLNGPADHLGRVIDLLMQGGSVELWSRCITRVALFISRPGVTTQLQRMVNGARAIAGDGHWSLQIAANVTEAWLHLWQGRIAELEATFQSVEEDSQWLGQSAGLRIRLLAVKVLYQAACGNTDAVHATRDAIVAHVSLLNRSESLPLLYYVALVMASAAIEDWPTVRMYLPELHLQLGRETPSMQGLIRAFEAQLALHEGRLGEALAALRELTAESASLDTMYLDATVRTQLALAELAQGSPAAAWESLEPLIERVVTSGNVGQVLVVGVRVLSRLSLAAWDGAASSEGLAVLRQWVETARQLEAGTHERPEVPAANDAGLSGRELEVLALLADNQSNKLIARALDLSPHTVKRHVARILDRLDLSSRMQAADWYRSRFTDQHKPPSQG